MRVASPSKPLLHLHQDLKKSLDEYRLERNFDPEHWLKEKSRMLNEYLAGAGLSSCVIGISGGIDSALALRVCEYASDLQGSPIEHIYACFLPGPSEAVTGQDSARERFNDLLDLSSAKVHKVEVDVTPMYDALFAALPKAAGLEPDQWAKGQSVAYLRTPMLYTLTSLLTCNDRSGLVIGTTNRDEGAYLGYVGKASDGLVDYQILADCHKSEVYRVAALAELGVPTSVLNVIPTGDMYDARPDEEVFGASYDFVELYQWYLNLETEDQALTVKAWSEDAQVDFAIGTEHLERLHRHNAHKYQGHSGSPAVHANVYQSAVKGGWQK